MSRSYYSEGYMNPLRRKMNDDYTNDVQIPNIIKS